MSKLPPCDHDECGVTECTKPAELAAAQGSADPTDSAPYWLCYGMAEWLGKCGLECERRGDIPCPQTSDCITEWCIPCAAKAWLDEQKRLSQVQPNVGGQARESDERCPAPNGSASGKKQ